MRDLNEKVASTRFVPYILSAGVAAIVIAGLLVGQRPSKSSPAKELVAHEWGTFTTRVAADGTIELWQPARAKISPLPQFVYTRWHHGHGKDSVSGTVRMETPVIYFYSPVARTVSVAVDFPQGSITEWYPSSDATADSQRIGWKEVRIAPAESPQFLSEAAPSHYYAARATDSAPIAVTTDKGVEREKFLFYRGVGTFELPLSARRAGSEVHIRSQHKGGIRGIYLFARQGAQIGYRPLAQLDDETTLAPPALQGDLKALQRELAATLVGQGLYAREAEAMIATWNELWFEEGLRVLYIVPRDVTDQILPLAIAPAPKELVRVLVGRIDLAAP